MIEERFWLLVSLRQSGEATAKELKELEDYLLTHPVQQYQADLLDSIWRAGHSYTEKQKELAFNRHMQRLSNHLSEPVLQYETAESEAPKRKSSVYRKLTWVTGIAASILLVWMLAFNHFDQPSSADTAKAQNTIMTKRGSKSKIQLPDGTEVWLNADSRITYNENFQGKIREVTLSGEAFFDVVKDPERPFVIHTDVIDIKVLGTAFNVRSYADERITETSLIRGSVEVTLRRTLEKYKLEPNDKLIVDNPSVGIDKNLVKEKKKTLADPAKLVKVKFEEKESTACETLWTKGKLAFDQEPLEEIARMLERWYDVKVQVDPRIRHIQYTGVFEDEGIDQVLRALKLSDHGFTYSINKKEVTIKP